MYTPASTITLGLVVVLGTYFAYFLFKKFKLSIDKNFVLGFVPWIFVSVFVRVYEDAGIYPSLFWTRSPGIEILFLAIVAGIICLSILIEKKYKIAYWKTMAGLGMLAVGFHLPLLSFVNVKGFLLVFMIFCITVGIISLARQFFRFDLMILWALAAHMVDASATFVSMTFFRYTEQHILPNFLIEHLGGSWVMFPLKFVVLIPVLFVINKYTQEDKLLRNTLLLAIITLGLAAGLRGALRLLMGV